MPPTERGDSRRDPLALIALAVVLIALRVIVTLRAPAPAPSSNVQMQWGTVRTAPGHAPGTVPPPANP